MRVNKLKLAALALSAVTCITSIPSVAFAEDFAAAFTSGGETEEYVEEYVLDEEPVSGAFEEFLFDDGSVQAEASPSKTIDLTTIRFHYKDDDEGYPALSLTYQERDESSSEGGLLPDVILVTEGIYIDETSREAATCQHPERFLLKINEIPGYETIGARRSSEWFSEPDAEALPHSWELVVVQTDEPSCEEAGSQTIDYQCTNLVPDGNGGEVVCGQLRSELEEDDEDYKAQETVDIPAIGHDWELKSKDIVKEDTKDENDKVIEAAVNCTYDPDKDEITVEESTKLASYTFVFTYVCKRDPSHTKKEYGKKVTIDPTNVAYYTIEIPEKGSNIVASDPYIQGFLDVEYPTYPELPENDKILLTNCDKDGVYNVVWYDGDDKIMGSQEQTVTAHHTLDKVVVRIEDGTGRQAENGDTETIPELNIVWDKTDINKVTSVTSWTCKEYTYSLVSLCKNEKDPKPSHEFNLVSGNVAAGTGIHSFNQDALEFIKGNKDKKIEAFKGKYDELEAGLTGEDGKLLPNVEILSPDGSVPCTEVKSITVRLTCPICGAKEDIPVELTEALKHTFGLPVTANLVQPNCEHAGGFDSVKTCTVCGYEEVKHYDLDQKPHVYASDDGDYSNLKLRWVNNYVVDSEGGLLLKEELPYPVEDKTYVGMSELHGVSAEVVETCKNCGKAERVYKTTVGEDGTETIDAKYGTITVTKVERFGGKSYCNEGIITLTASFDNPEEGEDPITLPEEEFSYFADYYAFNAHTWHEAGETKEEVLVEPTETTLGKGVVITYCRRCQQEMGRKEYDIPVIGHKHNPVKKEEVAATCVEDGMKEYYICDTEDCAGILYEDADCTKPTTEEALKIPATGHTPGEETIDAATFVQVEDYKDGYQEWYSVCEVCGEELDRKGEVIPCKAPIPAKVMDAHTQVYPATSTIYVYFDPVEDADIYRINYRVSGTSEWTKYPVGKPDLDENGKVSYTLAGFTAGEKYEIRVAAGRYVYDYKGNQKTGDDGIKWGTRSDIIRRLLGTTEATVTKGSDAGTIDVKWEPIEGASKYVIYYSTNKNMAGQKTLSVPIGSATAATISGLTSGTKYYVRVRPYTKVNGKLHSGSLSKTKAAKAK